MKPAIRVLVTDLDNTLFDWVDIWYRSFWPMLSKIQEISKVDMGVLKQEARVIHRMHGTSEYAFLIEQLPSLRKLHPNKDLLEIYQPAVDAYRAGRREALKLFPDVHSTLDAIRSRGTLVVAYTESMAFYTNYRMRKLELDSLIDVIFSPEDHELPRGVDRDQIRKYTPHTYELQHAEHRFTPAGELKPNPQLLLDILESVGAQPSDALFLGDSLGKDIAMAKDAGVIDVYAAYGKAQHREEYELLRQVSHWTDEDIEREKHINERTVEPTYKLKESISELLDLFDFQRVDR